MLIKFSVSNFKNFKDRIVLDFSHPSNYEFSDEAIKNGYISKSIVYGPNGSGKSNLCLALFDIVNNLTDKEKLQSSYFPFICLFGEKKQIAEFQYCFDFDGHIVVYEYGKQSLSSFAFERLVIDDTTYVYFDFIKGEGYTTLPGTETLDLSKDFGQSPSSKPISRIKYLSANGLFDLGNPIAKAFNDFISFVDRMLMFYCLDTRGYQGFNTGVGTIIDGILEHSSVNDFSDFLKENGLEYNLICVKTPEGKNSLYCRFKNGLAQFFDVASTGTRSLALLYYWIVQLKERASFVAIDEFDAFYHFSLARSIVERLKKIKNVQILLTSHNTDLMTNDLLRPDAYYVIGNGQIKSLNNRTDKELRRAHSLQKMYKAGLFDE